MPAASDPPVASHGSAPADTTRMLDVVRSVVMDVSDGRGLGRLTLDASFERDLGLGSLERVELSVRAAKAFGVELSDEAVGTLDTPRQLLAHINTRRTGPAPAAPSEEVSAKAALPDTLPVAAPTEAATLVDVLEYHVRHQPHRVHILLRNDDETVLPITYRDLHRNAIRIARALRERGVQRGRCVAIMLPTGLGYFASFFGVLLAGAIPVPLYPPFRLDRIAEYIAREARILDNAQAQVLLTFDRAARVADITRDRVDSIEHVLSVEDILDGDDSGDARPFSRVEITGEDTALLQYTSGSTGDPKGVELTQANVMSNIRAAAAGCELAPDDVMVSWLPLYHDMGLIGGWLMNFYFGNPTVLMSPLAFLTQPVRWLAAMTEYGGTISVAPNFAFDLCVKRIEAEDIARLDLHRLRALLNGSEPILPQTLDRFVERFSPAGLRREAIFCAYGLAENMVAVAFPPVLRAPRVDRIGRGPFENEGRALPVGPDDDALEFVSVGFAVPNHEVQVVDAEGTPVEERTQGRIWFRGPSTFKGYYRRPEATAAVQHEGGWVDSGDLGYTADGELFIAGRAKDLIIKGGRNYYPHEIEAAAGTVDGIRQGCVAAFAVPDPAQGTEQIVTVAETREQDAMAREALEGKIIEAVTALVGVPPDRVLLVPPGAVPKTSSGKIRRNDSRRLFLDGTIDQSRGSVTRQAAGLIVGSIPARVGQGLRRVGRVIYGCYAITTLAIFCLCAPVLGRIWPAGKASRRLAKFEASLALRLAALRPRVIGLSNLPEGAAILAANHASYLDFLVCTAALPNDLRFVIKGELRDNAFLGPFLTRTGHVFINRHVAAKSLADLEEVVTLVDEDQRVMLFPEGTFVSEIGMRPFKLGTFRLACQTGVPVVPVVLRGTRKALRPDTWLPRHQPLEVEILPPVAPVGTELEDIVRLRDAVADAIASKLDEPRLYAADISLPALPSAD
ncbi:MAG: AMP-binding protein [Deltaproteobacteria bacterium]|nr:AMP-binding protein [Deltaproteobacteria bacterium]